MENSKYYLSTVTDFVILLQPLTVRVKLLKTGCWCEYLHKSYLISVDILIIGFIFAYSVWQNTFGLTCTKKEIIIILLIQNGVFILKIVSDD